MWWIIKWSKLLHRFSRIGAKWFIYFKKGPLQKKHIIHSMKSHGETLSNFLERVLEMRQWNDTFSVVVLATELEKDMNCSINELRLSFAISHLEQKAAVALLTLLYLGIKSMCLSPKLNAFFSDKNWKFLRINLI